MSLTPSRAAAAALSIGAAFAVGGCAKPLPRSPVAMPLSDVQAIMLAENYLDDQPDVPADRYVAYVEPTGYGNLVSFRTAFDPAGEPPVQSRLVMVEHDGDVRELRFRRGK